jgi:phosphomannomutase
MQGPDVGVAKIGVATNTDSLRSRLNYQPQELGFGTSGRRGKVVDLTQLEVYLNALAELEYLQSLSVAEGGIQRGDPFYFAYDLRPSSSEFVSREQGRGEIAQSIVAAIVDAGMKAVNLGRIPTPALASYALTRNKGSIMVTGSHIPFDRNGYKTNSSRGELLKEQEAPINERVRLVRKRLYEQPRDQSRFDQRGMLKSGHQALPKEQGEARAAYIDRFTGFFAGSSLKGKRILVYQHSAVGRDLLVEILEQLGAEVVKGGRSETFVPIDTENIDAAQLAVIQALADEAAGGGPLDAVVSTDGDSDRPLVLGVDAKTGRVQFFGGDLVGMVVAAYLQADAVVVPISCNDAIDRGPLASVVEPKTRIGSPFVIAGMEAALAKGKNRVCGWEPNGGFLTGSPFSRNGAILSPLLTRDAGLPILGVLFAAEQSGLGLIDLFSRLPKRFSRAALLKQFPRATALKIVARFSPPAEAQEIKKDLAQFFTPALGFAAIDRLDYTDGVRILFTNGEVAHVRPSGNADELRIYAVADTQSRADAMAAMGIEEPGGILRNMEKAVHG